MKSIDKPRYLKESRDLYASLDVEKLIKEPNNAEETQKINRLIAIFTNFSSNDGKALQDLFYNFRKWARASTRINHIKNRASDMMQLIGQKIEEMDIYRIEDDTPEAIQERKKLSEGKYDVAFSFAGEQRDYIGKVASYIENRSTLKVFYDENEKLEIWGTNLMDYLKSIYEDRANYCVMFISKEYAEKSWPNFERQIIQARSLTEEGVLLPVRFDNTPIKGEIPTIAYLSIDNMKPEELAELIIGKVTGSGRYFTKDNANEVVSLSQSGQVITSENIPLLYIKPIAASDGGPNGHFVHFIFKNMANQVLLDISWGIRGFNYEWRADNLIELEPGAEKEVVFPISSEQVFNQQVNELNVFAEYRSLENQRFFVRRQLDQAKVPSGAFYEFKAAAFVSPTLLKDDGLKIISELEQPGDSYQMTFQIGTSGDIKKAKIGISRTFLSVWSITDESQIKQAIAELGHRIIRKMAREGNIQDYTFTTHDFPPEFQNGFEGYKQLRESIN